MKTNKLVLVCLLLVAVAIVASAITASARPGVPGFIVYTQPDGSKLTVSLAGSDEYLKIGTTVDGYTLMKDPNGTFFYAVADKKGDLVASNVKANDLQKRGGAEKAFVAKLAKGMKASAAQQSKGKTPQPQGTANMNTYTGSPKICVLVCKMKDVAWTRNMTNVNNMFNQHGYQSPISGQTGSYHEYMESCSGGLMTPIIDVYGPFNIPNKTSFYGQNGAGGFDKNDGQLLIDAVGLANATVNFAQYDNDNDGYVDTIVTMHSGYDECEGAPASCIWANTGSTNNCYPWPKSPVAVDGKLAFGYSTFAEYRGTSGTVASSVSNMCHEYAHAMNMPDTYNQASPLQCWDQMANGSWAGGDGDNPTSYCAWAKWWWGWSVPTTLTSPMTGVTMANRYNNPLGQAKLLTGNGYTYTLENVKKVGWDAYVWNSGMLVINMTGGINLVCADNANTCDAAQAGDVFPGTSNNTAFTSTSTPANPTGKNLVSITYPSYVSTFNVQ